MTKVENKADWYDRIAWGVVIPVFLLAVISLYGIWVATVNDPKMGSPVKAVITQAVWYLVSIALVIFVMQFDAEQLFKIAPIAYGIGIILLIAIAIATLLLIKLSSRKKKENLAKIKQSSN